MSEVEILFSWSNTDFSETNKYIFNSIPPGEIRKIFPHDVKHIINMRNAERRWYYKGDNSPLLDSDSVDDSDEYLIYLNVHKDNTFKSDIIKDKDNYKVIINNIEVDQVKTTAHFEVIIFKHKKDCTYL